MTREELDTIRARVLMPGVGFRGTPLRAEILSLLRAAEDALRYREATDELLELASSMASTAKCLAINSQFGASASERAAIAAEMRLSEIRAALAPKEENRG